MDIRTYFCMLVKDGIEMAPINIQRARPHFDEIIVIGLGSTDGTLEKLRTYSDIHLIEEADSYPNPAAARNKYLEKIAEMRSPEETSIYCRCDFTQFYSRSLLENVKSIMEQVVENQHNVVLIRRRLVSLDKNLNRVTDKLEDIWQPLIHVWEPEMRYAEDDQGQLIVPSEVKALRLEDFADTPNELLYEQIVIDSTVTANTTTSPVETSATQSNDQVWPDNSITYVVVTQDRLLNNQRNLPVILPYVDRAIIIDGYSKDGTYDYLKSFGSKVQVYQHPWEDSFAKQYNEYIKHLKGGWILLCDDDELPSEELLRSLRGLVEESDGGKNFGVVEFRANDVSYTVGKWQERHDNGPCEYYRQIFYKWTPNLRYIVDLHQALQGLQGPAVRRKEHYYHIKSTQDEYRNACRNYFIAGEWPPGSRADGIRTAEWHELKELVNKHHPPIKFFSDFNGLLVSGQIHPEIENWIRKHKDHNRGVEGESAGELRAYYPYYFEILHPEKA